MSLPGFGLDEDALAIAQGHDLLTADPVALFHPGPRWQHLFIENLRHRIYAHPANKTGKTTLLVVVALALEQGRKELGGIPLPRLPSPCIGALFSIDYKQQRLAVQETLLRWLGTWPHKMERDGETIVSLKVKPGYGPGFWASSPPSDDHRSWSTLGLYSQKNLASGTGFRLHFAGFDEPPSMPIYREVLKAGFPGYDFPTFIGATSIKRSQWYPLRPYFPLESEGRVVNGVIRLSGSVYDDGVRLSKADVADLERRYEPDPDRIARLYGHEINTTGDSPFKNFLLELERWAQETQIPKEVRSWPVIREVTTETGAQLVEESVDVEIHDDPIVGHRYRAVCDLSMGINDEKHDKGCVTVWDMSVRPVVDVAHYSGFIGEYGLGILAAGLARHYENALVDPDTTGGLGGGFLGGVRAAKYGRLVSHRTGKQELSRLRIGFVMSTDTRMEFAGALNEALLASQKGFPFLKIRSADIITDMLDLRVDDAGRPVTPAGTHDEGFANAGRVATLTLPHRRIEKLQVARPKTQQSVRKEAMKKYYAKLGQEMPREVKPRRARPRLGTAR